MPLSTFNVSLKGQDSSGEFFTSYRVVASGDAEASVLARASAALQNIVVLDIESVVDEGTLPEELDKVRRVLVRGDRAYSEV